MCDRVTVLEDCGKIKDNRSLAVIELDLTEACVCVCGIISTKPTSEQITTWFSDNRCGLYRFFERKQKKCQINCAVRAKFI